MSLDGKVDLPLDVAADPGKVDFEVEKFQELCAKVEELLLSLEQSDLYEVASGLGVRAGRIKNKSKLTVLAEVSNFIEKKCGEGVTPSLALLTPLHNDLRERLQLNDDNTGVHVSDKEESEGGGDVDVQQTDEGEKKKKKDESMKDIESGKKEKKQVDMRWTPRVNE